MINLQLKSTEQQNVCPNNQDEIMDFIIKYLDSKKAENIKIYKSDQYNLNFQINLTCKAMSNKHASSLANNLMQNLKDNEIDSGVSGLREANWIVVFNQDLFAIHILTEDGMEYYKLDELFESRKLIPILK